MMTIMSWCRGAAPALKSDLSSTRYEISLPGFIPRTPVVMIESTAQGGPAEREPPPTPELAIFDEQPLLVLREMVPADSFLELIENWFGSLATRIESLVAAAATG